MDTIINPINGNTYDILSTEGMQLLKSYIKLYQSGGAGGGRGGGGGSKEGGGGPAAAKLRGEGGGGGSNSQTVHCIGDTKDNKICFKNLVNNTPQPPLANQRTPHSIIVRTHNIGQCSIYGWNTQKRQIQDNIDILPDDNFYFKPKDTPVPRTIKEYLTHFPLNGHYTNCIPDIILLQEVSIPKGAPKRGTIGIYHYVQRYNETQTERGVMIKDKKCTSAYKGASKWKKLPDIPNNISIQDIDYNFPYKGTAILFNSHIFKEKISTLNGTRHLSIVINPIINDFINIYVSSVHFAASRKIHEKDIDQLVHFSEVVSPTKGSLGIMGGDFNHLASTITSELKSKDSLSHLKSNVSIGTSYGQGLKSPTHSGNPIDHIYFVGFDTLTGFGTRAANISLICRPKNRTPEYMLSDYDHKFLEMSLSYNSDVQKYIENTTKYFASQQQRRLATQQATEEADKKTQELIKEQIQMRRLGIKQVIQDYNMPTLPLIFEAFSIKDIINYISKQQNELFNRLKSYIKSEYLSYIREADIREAQKKHIKDNFLNIIEKIKETDEPPISQHKLSTTPESSPKENTDKSGAGGGGGGGGGGGSAASNNNKNNSTTNNSNKNASNTTNISSKISEEDLKILKNLEATIERSLGRFPKKMLEKLSLRTELLNGLKKGRELGLDPQIIQRISLRLKALRDAIENSQKSKQQESKTSANSQKSKQGSKTNANSQKRKTSAKKGKKKK